MTNKPIAEATGLTSGELQKLEKMVREDIMEEVSDEDRRLEKLVVEAAKRLGYEDEGQRFFQERREALRTLGEWTQDKMVEIVTSN